VGGRELTPQAGSTWSTSADVAFSSYAVPTMLGEIRR